MTKTLRAIVQRELAKIDALSAADGGILAPAHLEALESLAKVLKQLEGQDDESPPSDISPEDLGKLLGGG